MAQEVFENEAKENVLNLRQFPHRQMHDSRIVNSLNKKDVFAYLSTWRQKEKKTNIYKFSAFARKYSPKNLLAQWVLQL